MRTHSSCGYASNGLLETSISKGACAKILAVSLLRQSVFLIVRFSSSPLHASRYSTAILSLGECSSLRRAVSKYLSKYIWRSSSAGKSPTPLNAHRPLGVCSVRSGLVTAVDYH